MLNKYLCITGDVQMLYLTNIADFVLQVVFMNEKNIEKVVLSEKFDLFSDHWSPKIVGDLNDAHIKLAKFHGDFVWHKHDNEDELFLVIKGNLTIKLRDKDILLSAGEFVIIPKGVEHCPVAEEEVCVLLVEPKSTLNTGDAGGDLTVDKLDYI